MNEIYNLTAIRTKEYPPCLRVDASVWMYKQFEKGKFEIAESQPFVDDTLILEIIVEGDGPRKGIIRSVKTFELCNHDVQKYKKVTVRFKDNEKTIDVS